ncbi:hypothetical protein CTAYLR_004106 [Chrysophaeum taylorii]|uniref:PPIase cyclophilin-type domain-containing protein n=1 Tax=Chrysophaeum taylorii TaxID=2483200 RepID=A0AAD7UDQ4_9STRA|nr:hypothetical protein CTAYLR_004106 [Chrysophaeum taylorii]
MRRARPQLNQQHLDRDDEKKRRDASWWYPLGVLCVVLCVWTLWKAPPKPTTTTTVEEEKVLVDSNRVRCETTKGAIVIAVRRDWAPLGAARFLEMVELGFFDRVALFRAVENFLCQTGVGEKRFPPIPDDPHLPGVMKRGYLSFAGSGPNSRTTEFFFTYQDSSHLGKASWEVPFAHLLGEDSYATMDRWYTGYGDLKAFGGHAPDQARIRRDGRAYLDAEFPLLDYIDNCHLLSSLDLEW